MTNHKQIKLKIWGLILIFSLLITIPFIIPHSGFISLFAFVPLFMMEELISKNNIKHKFLYFYASFLLFNIFTTFWIWNISAAGAIAAIALNALQMSVIFLIFSLIKKRVTRKWLAFAALAIIWLAWEHTYFDSQISWPWLVLGNAFATSPYLVQWYEVTGSLGGTLWILVTNILLYATIKNRKRALAAITSAMIIIPVIASLIRYASYSETDNPIDILAIQPNIDPTSKYGIIPQYEIDDRFVELVQNNITPETDYIVTPETFTYDFNIDNPSSNTSYLKYQMLLHQFDDVKMILGVLSTKIYNTPDKPTISARAANGFWYDIFNTVTVIDKSGVKDYYHKSKLVPAVEFIPYQDKLPFLGKVFESFGGSSSSYGTMDDIYPLIADENTSVAGLICYESVYGEYARRAVKKGADFIAVITNDGWWGDTPGYKQHFRYAALRAIETRRDVVFVANTGRTGFFDQRGAVRSYTDYWVETTLSDTVNANRELTFFTKYGDIIGIIACWLMIAVILVLINIVIPKRR